MARPRRRARSRGAAGSRAPPVAAGSRRRRPRPVPGAPRQHHALAQRLARVPVGGDGREAAERGHRRRFRQRQRHDPALARSRGGELRGLRGVLAQHQVRRDARPQPGVLQRCACGAPVRRVLGVGDREAPDAALGERACQPFELRIDLQRRTVRPEQRQATDRVQRAAIARVTLVGEPQHVLLVGRQEQLERRAVRNLLCKVARRAEGEPDDVPGVGLEATREFDQCEFQVGRRCHGGHVGRPCCATPSATPGARQRER